MWCQCAGAYASAQNCAPAQSPPCNAKRAASQAPLQKHQDCAHAPRQPKRVCAVAGLTPLPTERTHLREHTSEAPPRPRWTRAGRGPTRPNNPERIARLDILQPGRCCIPRCTPEQQSWMFRASLPGNAPSHTYATKLALHPLAAHGGRRGDATSVRLAGARDASIRVADMAKRLLEGSAQCTMLVNDCNDLGKPPPPEPRRLPEATSDDDALMARRHRLEIASSGYAVRQTSASPYNGGHGPYARPSVRAPWGLARSMCVAWGSCGPKLSRRCMTCECSGGHRDRLPAWEGG